MRAVELPDWGAWLPGLRKSGFRYIVFYGGRGGGKSWTMARSLVLAGAMEPLRILCLRETMSSLADSSKPEIANAIAALDLDDEYEVLDRTIRCVNGTEFIFRGMSEAHRTAGRIRSFADVDVVWIEEAQDVTEQSWQVLVPTIRKPGAQICATFNPHRSTDVIYRRFVSDVEQPAKSFVANVNWWDNPWLPDDLLQVMREDRKWRYDEYLHIWEGRLAPDLDRRPVLLSSDLERCVEGYATYARHGEGLRPDVGLDVADTGADMNALAVRRGPVLEDVQQWRGSDSMDLGVTARRAHREATNLGVANFYCDVGGFGTAIVSHLRLEGRLEYLFHEVKFGEQPQGADVLFDRRYTNRAMFAMRNAQLAWALRLRAHRTSRLLAGESVDPMHCLFINPDLLRRVDTAGLLEQLNQPTWDSGEGNRYRIKKAQPGEKSPDMFDAVCLAFASDSRHGLRSDVLRG